VHSIFSVAFLQRTACNCADHAAGIGRKAGAAAERNPIADTLSVNAFRNPRDLKPRRKRAATESKARRAAQSQAARFGQNHIGDWTIDRKLLTPIRPSPTP